MKTPLRSLQLTSASINAQPLPTVLRHEGGLVIDRYGMALPSCRCFQCNRDAQHSVRKTYWSAGRILSLLLVLGPFLLPIILPLYLIKSKRASVEFGFCSDCYNKRLLGISLGIVLLILAVPLFLLSAFSLETHGIVPGLIGGVILCAGLFIIGFSRRLADARDVDDRWIFLRGGGPAFLRSIPEMSLQPGS